MSTPTYSSPLVDSHQHFWRLKRGDYAWLNPAMSALYRDFEPEHLEPLLESTGVRHTILVQAAATVDETRFLLSLAEQHPFIVGVVGWIDFDDSHALYALDELCSHPKFVGVRPMVQDIADPDWLLRPSLARAIRAVISHNLVFDALIRPQHLRTLLRFCDKYPMLKVVLDHGAKPDIATHTFQPWATELNQLARETSAVCKFSGLVTEAGSADRLAIAPFAEHLMECFGSKRLMWGSDWPVCETVCSYNEWFDLSRNLTDRLSASERDEIFGAVAQRVYGIATSSPAGS
jgi:L-fuconolactonase